jgi:hypothetical protein
VLPNSNNAAGRRRRFVGLSLHPRNPTIQHQAIAMFQSLPMTSCWTRSMSAVQSTEFVQKCIVNTTIAGAAAEGAGYRGTMYMDFKPFDLAEVYEMIGLLFMNGFAPQLLFEMWF